MRKTTKFIPQGSGLAAALLRRAATVELAWAARSGGRFEATDSAGRALTGELTGALPLRGGDVLVADDGSLVRVVAATEPVLVVRAPDGGSLAEVVRAAYHLGSRHVAVEPHADHLRIAPDAALGERLRHAGLLVVDAHLPFEPEVGTHDHDHGHDHGHDHAQGHGHGHAHGHAHEHAHGHDPHDHGPAHGHGPHDHDDSHASSRGHGQHHHRHDH